MHNNLLEIIFQCYYFPIYLCIKPMRNRINILNEDKTHTFTYLIEYGKSNDIYNICNSNDIKCYASEFNDNITRLVLNDVKYYRDKNDWYNINRLSTLENAYIPNEIRKSHIKVYLPNHSVSTYSNGIKYMISLNTWIGYNKIDLGSYMFRPTDAIACPGIIKDGNNEFLEFIEFDIIDPFYLIYSNDWDNFRKNICKEVKTTNNACSLLYVSLYVVNEYDERYIINSDYIGGFTNLNISDSTDYLNFTLSTSLNPLGLKYNINLNNEYDWFLDYLLETYNINSSHKQLKFQIVIKNKENVIAGSYAAYNPNLSSYGNIQQNVTIEQLFNNDLIKEFFNSWESFEEGWSFVASLNAIETINDNGKEHIEEVFSIVSNELPITQEVFSIFTNNGAEKIIDIEDMEINTYNVVNKQVNEIIQLERPNESKSNIIQPVFFKVKELEMLTLHPMVTENICINLDDYKSKVKRFILQIGNCKFEQIGANSYGVMFKIGANMLSSSDKVGTYYILNEEFELVTTGKYTCIY